MECRPIDKIGFRELVQWGSELRESPEDGSRVLGVGANEDVEVFGGARLGMDPERVTTDEEIFNCVRIQKKKEILEVLGQHQ